MTQTLLKLAFYEAFSAKPIIIKSDQNQAMPSKTNGSSRLYVLIAAAIGVFILLEWVSVFIFGHAPPGYP